MTQVGAFFALCGSRLVQRSISPSSALAAAAIAATIRALCAAPSL